MNPTVLGDKSLTFGGNFSRWISLWWKESDVRAARTGGKLYRMAGVSRMSLREFLLEQLSQNKNLTSLARELGATPQQVRNDMCRSDIVEVRRYYGPVVDRGVQSAVRYATIALLIAVGDSPMTAAIPDDGGPGEL